MTDASKNIYIFNAIKHTLFVYICGEPVSEVWLLKEAFRGVGMCPIRDAGGWLGGALTLRSPDVKH